MRRLEDPVAPTSFLPGSSHLREGTAKNRPSMAEMNTEGADDDASTRLCLPLTLSWPATINISQPSDISWKGHELCTTETNFNPSSTCGIQCG